MICAWFVVFLFASTFAMESDDTIIIFAADEKTSTPLKREHAMIIPVIADLLGDQSGIERWHEKQNKEQSPWIFDSTYFDSALNIASSKIEERIFIENGRIIRASGSSSVEGDFLVGKVSRVAEKKDDDLIVIPLLEPQYLDCFKRALNLTHQMKQLSQQEYCMTRKLILDRKFDLLFDDTTKLFHIMKIAYFLNIDVLFKKCLFLWKERKAECPFGEKTFHALDNKIARQYKNEKNFLLSNVSIWVRKGLVSGEDPLLIQALQPNYGSVWTTAINKSGSLVVGGHGKGYLTLYDRENELMKAFPSGHEHVTCLQFYRNEKVLLSAGQDGSVRVWDIGKTEPECVHTFICSELRGFSFHYFHRNHWLLAEAEDHRLCAWNLSSLSSMPFLFPAHALTIYSIDASFDESRFTTTSEDGFIKLWDTDRLYEVWSYQYDQSFPLSSSLGRSKDAVVVGLDSGGLSFFDIEKEMEVSLRDAHKKGIWSTIFADKFKYGALVLSGSKDNTIKLWDARVYDEVAILNHDRDVQSMAYHEGMHQLFSGSHDGTIKIWDVRKVVEPLKSMREEIKYKITEELIKKFASKKSIEVPLVKDVEKRLMRSFSSETASFLKEMLIKK